MLHVPIDIPPEVSYILGELEAAGHEAYVVGGSVRDALRGIVPKDWDICTSALPEQTGECFAGHHIIETGIKHGTITLRINHQSFEITTYRVDGGYLDNRHPETVEFVSDIQADLARRDFTINAMAYNPNSGLVDPFHGAKDLKSKQLRAVGNPSERFREDALRVMRALRLASVLAFEVEEATALSIHANKQLLRNIAVERLTHELDALLLGENVEAVLLSFSDVLEVIIPDIAPMVGFDQNTPYHYLDVWKHTVRSIAKAPTDRIVRLTMLFHDIAKPPCYTEHDGIGHFYGHPPVSAHMTKDILRGLKYDNETIDVVTELVFYHDAVIAVGEKPVKRWLNRLGEIRLRQLLEVKRADTSAQPEKYCTERTAKLDAITAMMNDILEEQQCFLLKDLAINGKDLRVLGIPEGKEIGNVLNKLLDMVIEGAVMNEKELLLETARSMRS